MSILIPQGFTPIAVRDDRQGTCVISYNPTTKAQEKYFIVVNGNGCGPMSLNDIKTMVENMKDVIDLRGKYNYIQDYDSDGTKKEEL